MLFFLSDFMLLTIDVGNTSITFAVFKGDEILADWRIGTVARRTGDEYAALLCMLFREKNIEFSDIDGVVISSVVPVVVDALLRFSRKSLGIETPLVISSEIDLGIKVQYNPISDVGADRLANAVGARAKYGGKLIVVDFGTAITIDSISEDGEYLGGAIAPGLQISLEALFSRAAKLTGVTLCPPRKAIGDSTAESLRSGIILGTTGLVDELVRRFQKEMGGGANSSS